MSHQFNVGDRVRVIKPGSRRRGVVCSVLGVFHNDCWVQDSPGGDPTLAPLLYQVDLKPDPGYRGVAYRPHELEPYYDGNEKASWSDCVWQPKVAVRS